MQMTSKQHTLIAFLLISALLSFFRIDLPGMTIVEEDFSLHWGILSIFGTTPWTADSWGAFADQAPYLSLGKSPFVNEPLPMWAMVGWTHITSQTLPYSRFLSSILASFALLSFYFIAKRCLKAEHAIFAPGFLAGSLMWNDIARHASPEIWGITLVLSSIALLFSIMFQQQQTWLSLIAMSMGLFLSVLILILSSLGGFALFLMLSFIALIVVKPKLNIILAVLLSITCGCLVGLSWYWTMDFPVFSQIMAIFSIASYIPRGVHFTTLIIDFALFPFFCSGLIIGIRKLFTTQYSPLFLFLLCWFFIAYAMFGFSAMIIPPFALLALMGLLSTQFSIQSIRLRWILIGYALILSAFGIAPRLVDAMNNGLFTQEWSAIGIIPLLLMIGIPLSSFFMSKDALSKLTYTTMSRALITLVIAALIKVAFANMLGKTRIEKDKLVILHQQEVHARIV